MSPLETALDRLKIADLWRILGLPGEPPAHDKAVCSPFRNDQHPSFSIFDGGRKWKDHGTGEHGDAADFLAMAKGFSPEEGARELIRVAGTASANAGSESSTLAKLQLPPAAKWDPALAQQVADSRRLAITAVEFAFLWLGTLSFRCVCNQRCWVLTDRALRCAEARRIDGEIFPAIGKLEERKSHSLRHSDKSWPVGILPPGFEEAWLLEHVQKIWLVEGGPDYLAACQLIAQQDSNVLPVALLGASVSIFEEALVHFADRQTTIISHGDQAGRDAAARWERALQRAGGLARIFNLKQQSDLCDCVAAGAKFDDISLF
jgi:Toprim domain-containing protein